MQIVKSLLTPSIKNGLQQAIEYELYQSNLWKHIANQLQRLGLFGGQKYFLAESAEELTHYQILVDGINDFGDVADMPKIDAIKDKIESLDDALTIGYEMEVEVYKFYKKLYSTIEEEDCSVAQFILQFIEIQRKAVGAYGDLLSRYEIAKKTQEILEFDEYLGELVK